MDFIEAEVRLRNDPYVICGSLYISYIYVCVLYPCIVNCLGMHANYERATLIARIILLIITESHLWQDLNRLIIIYDRISLLTDF